MPSPPASGTDGGPRYLIAVGTQSYLDPADRLEQVPGELRRITELFREYGFKETLTDLRLDPKAQEFQAGLEDWLTDEARDPEAVAVIYYTGHGFTTPGGHYLAFRDTVLGKVARAVETGALITLVGPAPRVRRLLIIIDACESGAGLLDAVRRAAQAAAWQLPWQWREGIWVIAATRPKEDAAQGAFASAFVHAVRRAAQTIGTEQEFLSVETILDYVNEQLQGSSQQATAAPAPYGTGLLPIFRNPSYQRRTGAERLRADEIFTGRVRALEDLSAWLDGTDPRPRVVTGDPGSGKSALLGQVAARTEHVVPVSALKRTSQGLMADLATAAGQVPATMSEFVASVPDGTLIVVDGLDESVQPYDIMADVLAPLAAAPVRLLVASRRPYHQRLPFAADVIDLDTPRYYERADVRDYVTRLLASPALDGPATEAIAAVIAERADHSFLLARGAALAVRNQDRPLSPGEVAELMTGWEGAGAAFDADLEQRFGGAAARVRELLAPLAWSYGQGLPWENIWADAATALSEGALSDGASYDDVDVRWVLDGAYSYLREDVDQGRSVYRLFHAELARYLRGDRDPSHVNRRLAELLIRHVATYGGQRDWQAAHPYVRRHLAEHAAAAGMLDELVTDPGFLLAAAGPGLTRSVRSVTTPAGRAAANTYLRAASQLVAEGTAIAERAAYLEFAAQQNGNESLARTAGRWAAGSPWRPRWTRWNGPQRQRLAPDEQITAMTVCDFHGERVAVLATKRGELQVRRLADGTNARTPITAQDPRIVDLDLFSAQIRVLAAGEVDEHPVVVACDGFPHIRAWDLDEEASNPIWRHNQDCGTVAMALSELTGIPVVIAAGSHTLSFRRARDGTALGDPYRYPGTIRALAMTQLNSKPAIAINDDVEQRVAIWKLPDPSQATNSAPLSRLRYAESVGPRHEVTSFAVLETSGRSIAVSGDDDGYVRSWDLGHVGEGEDITPIGRHHNSNFPKVKLKVNAVAINQVNGQLIAASGDPWGRIQVWDVADKRRIADFDTGHISEIRTLAVTDLKNEAMVVSHADDGTALLWDLTQATQTGPATVPKVSALAFTDLAGAPVLLVGGLDGTVRILRVTDGLLAGPVFRDHTGEVTALAAGEIGDKPVVLSAGIDGTVRIWDPADGRSIGEPYTDHNAVVTALAVKELGGRLIAASGGYDSTVRIWDVANRTPLGQPIDLGATVPLGGVRFAGLGPRPIIITASDNRAPSIAQAWDLINRDPVGHAITLDDIAGFGAVTDLQLGSEPLVIFSDHDGVIRLRGLTNTSFDTDLHCSLPLWCRAVAATVSNGQITVMAGSREGGVLNIWELESSTQWRIDVGSSILALAARPDRILAVGAEDGVTLIRIAPFGGPVVPEEAGGERVHPG